MHAKGIGATSTNHNQREGEVEREERERGVERGGRERERGGGRIVGRKGETREKEKER